VSGHGPAGAILPAISFPCFDWTAVIVIAANAARADFQIVKRTDVPVTVAIVLCGLDQLFNLSLGQVLSAAQLVVRSPSRGDCSFFGGWRDQLQVRFGHGFPPSLLVDCSYNTHFTSSTRDNLAAMVSEFCRLAVVIRSADSGASGRAAFHHPGLALGKRHVVAKSDGVHLTAERSAKRV
jgi:hypothetical protein